MQINHLHAHYLGCIELHPDGVSQMLCTLTHDIDTNPLDSKLSLVISILHKRKHAISILFIFSEGKICLTSVQR